MRFLNVRVIAPAVALPVSVSDFVDHARLNGITVDRQPELVERELRAATARAERFLRRSILTQTLRALFVPDSLTCACTRKIELPRGKVQSVVSVSDRNGVIAVDGYAVDLDFGTVTLNAAAYGDVTVEFVSGYGDTGDDVPDTVKEGILEYACTLYEDRPGERASKYESSSMGIPNGVRDLWRSEQIEVGG